MSNMQNRSADTVYNDIVRQIYDGMDEKAVSSIFPKGYESAKERILVIADILFEKSSTFSQEEFQQSQLFYVQMWIRKSGGVDHGYLDNSVVKARMIRRFSTIPEERVSKAADYCLDGIYSDYPVYLQRDHASGVMNMAAYEADEEFGLVPHKPVYIAGFGADKEYLNRLKTPRGEAVLVNRMCSIRVDGFSGPVDQYSVSLTNGAHYCNIYLWNYAVRTSRKAPIGLIGEFPPWETLEGAIPKMHEEKKDVHPQAGRTGNTFAKWKLFIILIGVAIIAALFRSCILLLN